MTAAADGTWSVVGADPSAGLEIIDLTPDGDEFRRTTLSDAEFIGRAAHEPDRRWIWADTPTFYPRLLSAGVRVARCRDLRLSHAILRDAAAAPDAVDLRGAVEWDLAAAVPPGAPTLFDVEGAAAVPLDVDAAVAEFRRQRDAVAASRDPRRLDLLLAAESAGALIAEELRSAGLPWDADAHDRILRDILGERPRTGGLPARVAAAAQQVREALGDPEANLDSHPKLLRSLHRSGILVESTSRWELAQHEHPVVAPLIAYKRLTRLQSANGWAWLEEWVRDRRFRPIYVPAGVVTGRWASSGGGALQIPRQLRPAVSADPGWRLVIADVAQLEPRVLAAIASDSAMAEAARGRDLYEGIVEGGAVATRAEAKVALLGAMYGATTGESGRLVPRLRRAYPRAMALVDDAARTGEDGGVVSTWLGRTSPGPEGAWRTLQSRASDSEASDADEARARRNARDRGRFTRNFVVQGTAAEWALCWLASVRRRLDALPPVGGSDAAPASGPAFASRAHLAFYLHDEIIVHTPAVHAEAVAGIVREAAAEAGRLLFGDFPVDFPLDLHVTDTAAKA